MGIFESAGIASVCLDEIVAFTPTALTLQGVAAGLENLPSDEWVRLSISARLYFEESGWKPEDGLPSRSRSTDFQVLSRSKDNLALRLLKDGTSTILRSRIAQPDDLIGDLDEHIPQAQEFAARHLSELVAKKDGDPQWTDLALDGKAGVALPLDRQPPYPVFEVALTTEERLKCLVQGKSEKIPKTLDSLLLYLIARNYRLGRSDSAGLKELCAEVLSDVLDDGLLLTHRNGRPLLRNLSQGTRVFIAFGRRGTVIVYTRSIISLPIRCSVLSMVETLRSRAHNLLVASTLMDTLLLRLAQLMETTTNGPVSKEETEAVRVALRELATATYIYGLAVTDPGVQLLDGSIISIIADRAENYFEMQSLRHACQRKMEAIRIIWASYQDRRRQTLLRALRAASDERVA